MPISHWLNIFSPTGTNPITITNNPPGNDPTKGPFTNLAYTNVLNGYGPCSFTLYGNHLAVASLVDQALVEVWSQWPEMGLAPHIEWSGVYKDEDSETTVEGGDIFKATCYSDAWWLSTRAIAYPAGTANRSLFSGAKGETIMKTLVTYNATASGTTVDGRDELATITGVSVQADGANGNTQDWACANENLLDNLAKLAPGAGGDFDLIKTGAAAWEFRWYTGQRGTDRTATVKFSIELGNMANPSYSMTRSGERTVALVKGAGTGSDRVVVIRTGANYSASNKSEMYVNASSQATTTATLNATGDAALKSSQANEVISFDALPFPNSIYNKHWFLGDKVSVKYKSHNLTPRIVMVTTTVDQQAGVTIRPGMAVNV